ncbi:MAG: prolipoprotein diacylglyceryl transferase [Deltaproteobacteria bacterium]|nr:prolipoprotein diacylglyceryl transferase [Deltaproteobacteria bacterium]
MHPVLLYLGDWPIHAYGVMGAVAFTLIAGMTLGRARREGLEPDRLVDVMFWTSVAGLVGARGLYVWANPEAFPTWTSWLHLRSGGLVFYGALFTGLPAALSLMRQYHLPVLRTADLFATALPLGHALSRVGCFLAGCCYGAPTDLPWGVSYHHPLSPAPHGVPVHPTQLYAVAYLVAIGVVVNATWYRRRFDGQVLLTYLLLYSAARSLNELVRGDAERGFVGVRWLGELISTSQALSALLAVLCLVAWRWLGQRAR